ncbi:MAG TPA: hypothetical protein VN726_06015 [Hanamia sp.]|nr:hypothetical protein [Hanamia sp.]
MNEAVNNFEISYREEKIKVQRHSIGSQTIFRIVFSNKTPLVITRATHENAYRFWTSIPEGRQREAEEIGKLIEEFYKTK